MKNEHLYHQLAYYTLARGDQEFIHQHLVDAFAAQNADETAKPIGVVFALVGLYLHVEKGFTGRQVQKAHTRLAQRRKSWPKLAPPKDRGSMTAEDVLAAESGPARDAAIHAWCEVVWNAWQEHRSFIAKLVERELDVK